MAIAVQLPGYRPAQAAGLADILSAGNNIYTGMKQRGMIEQQSKGQELTNAQKMAELKAQQQLGDETSPTSMSEVSGLRSEALLSKQRAQALGMDTSVFDPIINSTTNGIQAQGPDGQLQTRPMSGLEAIVAKKSISPLLDAIKSAEENAPKMLEAQAKAYEAGMPIKPPGSGPSAQAGGGYSPPPKIRMKAMEDFNSSVEASRQSDDAKQSLKDILAAKKINEIVSQAPDGDLNKLNNQQTKLAIMEVVKMAGGSVPTQGELDEMTPNNMAQRYGGLVQRLTNKSQPANAGEFLRQGIDYANGIANVGKQGLSDRSDRIADRMKDYLGPVQYKLVKDQIAKEFVSEGPAKQAARAPLIHASDHHQADAALSWAMNPRAPGWNKEQANKIIQRLNPPTESAGGNQ